MSIKKSLFLLLSLQMVIKISEILGQKGAGIIAGAAATSILTQNTTTELHHNFHNDSNRPLSPSVIPATTVERIETFANGCYKQIIKEADLTDVRRFIETEQLICPPGIRPASVTILSDQMQQPLVPIMPGQPAVSVSQLNTTNYYAAPANASEIKPPNIVPANATHIAVLPPNYESSVMEPHNSTIIHMMPIIPDIENSTVISALQPNRSYHPVPSYVPVIKPPPLIPSAPNPAVTTKQMNGTSVMYPPVLTKFPNSTTSQVVNISKKVGFNDHGKKPNAANAFYNVNCLVVFVVITIFSITI